MTALASVEDIRRMLYPPWYRRINWRAIGGFIGAMVTGSAIWYGLIWGAVEGWKYVGR